MKIYLQDIRSVKYCSRGARKFCELYDIDWEAFLKDGIEEDVLLQFDDAMVLEIITAARKRYASERSI